MGYVNPPVYVLEFEFDDLLANGLIAKGLFDVCYFGATYLLWNGAGDFYCHCWFCLGPFGL